MRERPILFCGEMVRAILAGTKTQTRRVVKPQPEHVDWFAYQHGWCAKVIGAANTAADPAYKMIPCPYGQPGDRLWVRETFKYAEHWHGSHCCTGGLVGYKADGAWLNCGGPFLVAPNLPEPKWRPSIFMPRIASRITLEVTEVRVQRVQEMFSDDYNLDVFAEGICQLCEEPPEKYQGPDDPPIRCGGHGGAGCHADYKAMYRDLWDKINGKRGFGWGVNPWVWALTFKVEEIGKGGAK